MRPELVCWWCEPLLHNRGKDCKTAGRDSLLVIFGVVSNEVEHDVAATSHIESTFNDFTDRDGELAETLSVTRNRDLADAAVVRDCVGPSCLEAQGPHGIWHYILFVGLTIPTLPISGEDRFLVVLDEADPRAERRV